MASITALYLLWFNSLEMHTGGSSAVPLVEYVTGKCFAMSTPNVSVASTQHLDISAPIAAQKN